MIKPSFQIPYRLCNALLFTKVLSPDERGYLVDYIRDVGSAANEFMVDIITLKREIERLKQENQFLTQQLQEDSMSHPGMTPEESEAYAEMLREKDRGEEKFTQVDDPEEKLDSDDDSVVK